MGACTTAPAVSRALELLACRRDLERSLAAEVLDLVMAGEVGEVQTAAFLMGLRTKGETADEIVGLATTMRALAERVEVSDVDPLVDTCGTGGDGLGTFNISTTAAFVVAGAGVPVAKHGNRGATSRSGSADVLEALGVCIELGPDQVAGCIREVGVGFMFAPLHHRALRHLMPVRRELGIRTIFNFLGPLTNPAGARRQVVGVGSGDYLETVAYALAAMGCRHALVVRGAEGLDELSVTGDTNVIEVREGRVGRPFRLEPERFGLGRWPLGDLAGADPAENARISLRVLEGVPGAAGDVVLLNAAAALYVSGVAASLQEGVEVARASIESGNAREKVDALVRASRTAHRGEAAGGG